MRDNRGSWPFPPPMNLALSRPSDVAKAMADRLGTLSPSEGGESRWAEGPFAGSAA